MSNKPFLKKLLKLEQQQSPSISRRESEIDGEIQNAFIVTNDLVDQYVEVCSKTGIITAHGDNDDEFVGADEGCDWVYSLVDDLLQ